MLYIKTKANAKYVIILALVECTLSMTILLNAFYAWYVNVMKTGVKTLFFL